MPYDNRTSEVVEEYSYILGELQAAMSELPTNDILCTGDFNADPTRGRLWSNVVEFCDGSDFSINDLFMTPDTFTFLMPSNSCTSWINHVLCSGDITLSNFKILYDCAIFDHFPLSVTLDIEVTDSLYKIKCNLTQKFINWELFDKQTYIGKSESLLRDLNICDKIGCTVDHRNEINEYYDLIVRSILEASEPYCHKIKTKFTPVPGWNTHCI